MNKEQSFTIDLTEISKKNKGVGNKALNLGKLIRNKFSIPKGFVVKSTAYDYFLKKNNLIEAVQKFTKSIDYNNLNTIKNSANIILNLFKKGSFPKEIIDEIKLKYQPLSSHSVAVRSSATAEDMPKASFAGQYDTFLNILKLEIILDKIKQCYASLWTNRAIIYRHKNKIPHDKVKIAVIIQQLVSSESAGVLFTINPITSNNTELMIESNFGLGESIVAGKCSPDQFIIKKLKNGLFKILDKRIGMKEVMALPNSSEKNGGIEYRELPEKLNQISSLSEDQIIRLANIGMQIEKIFNGNPQDIEWAINQDNKIKILQTRPVTTASKEKKKLEILWSRGYSDDYWNDNVTPLYFELLGDPITKVVNIELNSIMGYKKIDTQLLKLYKAHVYFNLQVIKKKIENEIPKFMRNEDILNYFPEGSGTYGKKTMKNLPFHLIKRIVAELRILFHDPNGSMSKTANAYDNWNQEVFIPYCNEFDIKLQTLTKSGNSRDLIKLAEELDRIMITHFRLIRYGIPVHNIGMNLLIQYLLTRFLGEKECSKFYPILVSGLKNKLTETNEQIYILVSIINKFPELKSIFIHKKSVDIYNTLINETNSIIKEFLIKFENFLEKYGDRGFTREIFYPRWKEFPMINLMDILKSLVMDQWKDLESRKYTNLRKRKLIEKVIETKIRMQKFGLLKWKFFTIILKNSRKYISFRENQRFNLDKWITKNRNVYLEIGKLLSQKGIISDENKIFFLYKHEIKNLIMNKYNQQEIQILSSKIKTRYDEFKRNENKVPPKFLLGSLEFNDMIKDGKDSDIFHGLAASQGLIHAPLRIIHNIELISTVKAGEILVVARTDPGWTAVFSKIGGLITETGGILSHGAVVSREYNIPAVTNITNACQIFKTGQIAELNGYNGTVILQKNT